MTLRNSILADYFYRILEWALMPKLEHPFVRPNRFTILGLLFALAVPFSFYVHPFWGLLLIGLSGSADAMDGLVAKNQRKRTVFGAFLDSNFDRISDGFYLIGFWILFWEDKWFILATFLIFLSLLFTFMISYSKAKAESLESACEVGFMDRGVRVVYLIAWALILCIFYKYTFIILWTGLVSYCALTFFTLIHRILDVRARLTDEVNGRL